jgi:hypothetical protein
MKLARWGELRMCTRGTWRYRWESPTVPMNQLVKGGDAQPRGGASAALSTARQDVRQVVAPRRIDHGLAALSGGLVHDVHRSPGDHGTSLNFHKTRVSFDQTLTYLRANPIQYFSAGQAGKAAYIPCQAPVEEMENVPSVPSFMPS